MKNILVVGSTKDDIHIGCNALISGLENLIKSTFGNEINIQHLSHRFLSPIFYENILAIKQDSKSGVLNFFGKKENLSIVRDLTFQKWEHAYNQMFSFDNYLRLTINNADAVIVNVEGTIHHKSLLGHQMLAIGKMASELKKDVYWVNFSIQDENEKIIYDALKGAKRVAARESMSFNYLEKIGVDVVQSFDTAILATIDNSLKPKIDNNTCLFTGSNIKSYDLMEIVNVVKEFSLKPLYLPMGLNDYDDLEYLKQNGVDCIEYFSFSYSDIIELIKESPFIISGRHHLNVFCVMANKAFIPLRSNTWKIEGVCDMLNYSQDLEEDIKDRINEVINNRENIESSMVKMSSNLESLAKLNLN